MTISTASRQSPDGAFDRVQTASGQVLRSLSILRPLIEPVRGSMSRVKVAQVQEMQVPAGG